MLTDVSQPAVHTLKGKHNFTIKILNFPVPNIYIGNTDPRLSNTYIHGGEPEVCPAQTSFLSLCFCFLCFHWVPLFNILFLYGEVGTEH